MRITLIGIASKYIHHNLAPWCLKAGLLQYGVHMPCQVLELNINQPFFQMLEALMETKPRLAGFSCYIWNIEKVRALAACLKLLLPDTIIVLGGPEAGSRPQAIFKEIPQADYVISGPGEYAFARLAGCLQEGATPVNVPGVSFWKDGKFSATPPAPLPKPSPPPYTPECLQSMKGRIVYAETSRGCPFRCTFCLSGQEESVSFLPLEEAKTTLLLLANCGAKTVKLTDRTFNCNRERAFELFRFLMEKHGEGAFPPDVCFHFEVAADLFDTKTLALLRNAPPGLFQMEAGLQSFHEKTLEACRRKTNLQTLSENIAALLSGQNIHLHVDLIAGLPYEDFATFGESVNKGLALRPHMLQLGFLKLLHGSRLREQREEFGMVHTPDPPYEVLKTNWLSFEDICLLKKCEEAVERLYNSGRFRQTLGLVLEHAGESPFALFCRLGEILAAGEGSPSLDRLTETVLSFFSSLPGISNKALRDALAQDRLSSDNSGYLPPCLTVPDPRLKGAIAALRKKYPPGARLGACLLYAGEERFFWADYAIRDPVTGLYETHVQPL